MAGRLVKKCPCLRPKIEEEVRILDYRHSSLQDVPSEVFNVERTLEELYTDSNQIRDLPRELFYCHGLRKLSISDNEITSIPPAISSLANLEELDFSKNGVIDVPDTIKGCKYLRSIDASVNPLGKLPEGFTQLANLTHLYLNDTFIDYLPGSFGRMTKLQILEIRENHLKTLPRSFSRLVSLERLDIGNNEFSDLSDVIGSLTNLLELWCDNNQITTIHPAIGNLKQLIFVDASKNKLQELPEELEGCTSLADIHLTSNRLLSLPESLGNLINLTTLKVDDNQLTSLPKTLGGLTSLSELNVSENDLEDLPASIGLLRNIRTFYADENLLQFIPAELGSCSGITILSLRSNKLSYIPDEIGRIPRLRVLNLSDNLLRYLPFTIVKLKELQALWLTENQTRPLIPLQSEYEEETGRKILTCYLLPQGELQANDERDQTGDTSSFHASMWDQERLDRQQIHFDFNDNSDEEGTLVRCPTPYPKEMRGKVRHARNLAMRRAITDVDGNQDSVDTETQETRNHGVSANFDEPIQSGFGYSRVPEQSDVRIREARITKPNSPTLQESHRLYRYDKEKQLKDKARMQHRLSVPDIDSDTRLLIKEEQSKKGKTSDMARLSGSTPDLTVAPGDGEKPCTSSVGVTTSYAKQDDVYQRQLLSQHRGRRSRRMREYDSDTGYRSDLDNRHRHDSRGVVDAKGDANSETLSVRSQPLPRHHHHHQHNHHRHRRKEGGRGGGGYNSDVDNYGVYGTANAAAAAYQQQQQQQRQHHRQLQQYIQSSNNSSSSHHQSTTPSTNPHNHRPHSPSRSEPRNYSSERRLDSDSRSAHSARTAYNPNFISNDDYQKYSSKGNNSNNPNSNINTSDSNTPNSNPTAANNEFYGPSSFNLRTSNSNPHIKQSVSGDFTHNSHSSSSNNPSSSKIGSIASLTSRGHSSSPKPPPPQSRNSKTSHHGLLPPPVAPKPNMNNATSIGGGSNLSMHAPNQSSTSSTSSSSQQQQQHHPPPVFHNESFLDQSTPIATSAPTTVMNASVIDRPRLSGGVGGGNSYSSTEDAGAVRRSSSRGASSGSNQPTPPPYPSVPPYRRPLDSNGRTSSESSSTNRESPQTTYLVPHHNMNKSRSSPCGFHGNNPYSELPSNNRDKLSYGDYADVDRLSQGSGRNVQDNHTTRSGSSSSHIGSASQIGPPYRPNSHLGRNSERNFSDSSDSRSDLHTRTSPHDFRPSGGGNYYGLHQSSSNHEQHFDPYSTSFEMGNLDEMKMVPNQEQSSQVSSSTDSGYGHGHHVYERIGDFKRGPGSHSSGPTSTPPSQRQTPTKRMLENNPPSREMTPIKDQSFCPDSTTEDHRDEFRVTIKKNPGLGFSIAGGIGSMGNPFRVNDKGIFVTKIIANGPASSQLRPGDKILEVNNIDFRGIHHNQAVSVLKNSSSVNMLVERIQKVNMV